MFTNKTPKNSKKFICETCDFKCCNKQDYNRHLSTRKHEMFTHVDANVYGKIAKKLHKKTINIKKLVLFKNGTF